MRLRSAVAPAVVALAAGGAWLGFAGTDECRAQAGGGDVEARLGCSGAPTACAANAGFARAAAVPAGRRVRLRFTRRVKTGATVEVFQSSAGGRILGERRIARFTKRKRSFTWDGRRARDGYLFVRFRVRAAGGTDVRRSVLVRRGGRFAGGRPSTGARAARRSSSSSSSARCSAGARNRSLGIAYRVAIALARVGRRAPRQEGRATLPHPHAAAGQDGAAAARLEEAAPRPPPGADHGAARARRDDARLAVRAEALTTRNTPPTASASAISTPSGHSGLPASGAGAGRGSGGGGAAPIRPEAGNAAPARGELRDDGGHLGRHLQPRAVLGAQRAPLGHGGHLPALRAARRRCRPRSAPCRTARRPAACATRRRCRGPGGPRRRRCCSRRRRTPPPSRSPWPTPPARRRGRGRRRPPGRACAAWALLHWTERAIASARDLVTSASRRSVSSPRRQTRVGPASRMGDSRMSPEGSS